VTACEQASLERQGVDDERRLTVDRQRLARGGDDGDGV
jgi:hypothetical protein